LTPSFRLWLCAKAGVFCEQVGTAVRPYLIFGLRKRIAELSIVPIGVRIRLKIVT